MDVGIGGGLSPLVNGHWVVDDGPLSDWEFAGWPLDCSHAPSVPVAQGAICERGSVKAGFAFAQRGEISGSERLVLRQCQPSVSMVALCVRHEAARSPRTDACHERPSSQTAICP